MRLALSFLLSLLMLAATLGLQAAGVSPAQTQSVVALPSCASAQAQAYAVDVLQEFEEDVDDDALELSMYRPHRTAELNTAQEDCKELFGPPEGIAVGVAPAWVPPQAHVTHFPFPWPEGRLRPPKMGLPQAGRHQSA